MLLCQILLLIFSVIYAAEANPSGAPAVACSSLTPVHVGLLQSDIPYFIDLSPFADGNGGYQYTPDTTYTISLSATSGTTFRGFLVQCRLMADDKTRVGVFAATVVNSRLSLCTPNTDGVTHVNLGTPRIEFTSMTMEWTAPPEGTGDVRFAFAVVQEYTTFWANQRTPVVSEAEAPQPFVPLETTRMSMLPQATETPVSMTTKSLTPTTGFPTTTTTTTSSSTESSREERADLSVGVTVAFSVILSLLVFLPVGVVIGCSGMWMLAVRGRTGTEEKKGLQTVIYEDPTAPSVETAIPISENQAYDQVNIH